MSQTILKSIEELAEIVSEYQKIFLVHGRSYSGYGMEAVFAGKQLVEFTEFSPNPKYEDIVKGVDLFRKNSCDAIVAVGGGSAIDVAKSIKLYAPMNPETNYLTQPHSDSGIPLIAVPTTAGTGSESTRFAVIYAGGVKQSIAEPYLVPDVAVLIPELLRGLPVYQKKCTFLDAYCQAIESYWSVHSTEESKQVAMKAILLLRDNWQDYLLREKYNENVYARIMEGSNLAGQAINYTSTTAPHAMSYKLTGLYGLPHGHSVALGMVEVWRYLSENADKSSDARGDAYFCGVMATLEEIVGYENYCKMLEVLEMKQPVAGDYVTEIDMLTKAVNIDRLKNSPVLMTADIIRQMYERIVKR